MEAIDLREPRLESFAELIGNGKHFRVPLYQREYSWEEDLWEDLWQDLVSLAEDERRRHFMGVVVLDKRGEREFMVVDGQQRLVTLSILCIAAIRRLERLAESLAGESAMAEAERAEQLRRTFVSTKNPVSLHERAKLRLNETDGSFFDDFIVHSKPPPEPKKKWPQSHLRLWNCLQYFDKCLDSNRFPNGESLARLVDEVVGQRTRFIRLTVESEGEAYTLFETMNARMLELSGTDLIRNLLFSKLGSDEDKHALSRHWIFISQTVGQAEVPTLIRYHLSCTHAKVRERRLLQLVQPELTDARGVFQLMNTLQRRAPLFAALQDEDDLYWDELGGDAKEARRWVRFYRLLRISQPTPLLFVAKERFLANDFVSVLRLVSVLAFRATVVARMSPGSFEAVYHDAAKAISDARQPRVSRVRDALRRLDVPNEKFKQDFANLQFEEGGRAGKLWRYVLSELEGKASGRAVDFRTDPSTVEHIWPRAAGWEWTGDRPSGSDEPPHWRLGNVVLVEHKINKDARGKPFSEKQRLYATSKYALCQELSQVPGSAWGVEEVEKRQQRLAALAATIWDPDASA